MLFEPTPRASRPASRTRSAGAPGQHDRELPEFGSGSAAACAPIAPRAQRDRSDRVQRPSERDVRAVASVGEPGQAFGIDIGGTGIKGAVVDTTTGELVTQRKRILTPTRPRRTRSPRSSRSSSPMPAWTGPVGATFPAVIQHGDRAVGGQRRPELDRHRRRRLLHQGDRRPRRDVFVLNDADAAGIAEARFGAARGVAGVVILLTFGTGIGSALLVDGGWCPTPSSGTSNWTATTPRSARRPRCATSTRCPTRTGRSGSSATWPHVERLFTPGPVRRRRRRQQGRREVGAAARTARRR